MQRHRPRQGSRAARQLSYSYKVVIHVYTDKIMGVINNGLILDIIIVINEYFIYVHIIYVYSSSIVNCF